MAQSKPPAMPVTAVEKEPLAAPVAVPSGPVVVELFTARSCVFCPQAEQLFAALADKPGVIALACPVDYLKDGDPLAQGFCKDRQGWYMGRLHAGLTYTPQLIVNGRGAVVGSKTDAVTALMRRQRADAIAPITIVQSSTDQASTDQASTHFLVTLPDVWVRAREKKEKATDKTDGLVGWQLVVASFLQSEQGTHRPRSHVADQLQVVPLDQYKGPAFDLSVPLSDKDGGVVVFLQNQDTGAIAAAGQAVNLNGP